MTAPPRYTAPPHYPGPRQPGAPGVVLAAVIVTWVSAALTALLTAFMAASFLFLADPVFDTFDDGLLGFRSEVLLSALATLVLLLLPESRAWFRRVKG